MPSRGPEIELTDEGLYLRRRLLRERIAPFAEPVGERSLRVAGEQGWVTIELGTSREREAALRRISELRRHARWSFRSVPSISLVGVGVVAAVLAASWWWDATGAGALLAMAIVGACVLHNRRSVVVGTEGLFVGWSFQSRPLLGRLFRFEDLRDLEACDGTLTLTMLSGARRRLVVEPEAPDWRQEAVKEILRRRVAYETARAAATFSEDDQERISNPSLSMEVRLRAANSLAARSCAAAEAALALAATSAVCPHAAETLQRAARALQKQETTDETTQPTPRPVP